MIIMIDLLEKPVTSKISLPHMICILPNMFQVLAWRWTLQGWNM